MQVALSMPKLEFGASFELSETLAAMGMPSAFNAAAEFSGVDSSYELFISAIVHRAFVAVDEARTEGAAATVVIVAEKGLPEAPLEVRIDRPFIFLIRVIETEAILFLGRVVDLTS